MAGTVPSLEIRAYRETDLPPLLTVMNQIVARGDAFVYDPPFNEGSMRAWIGQYAHVYVAEHAGKVVGAYLLRPNFPGRGRHVCNAAYMVDETVRGLGVGRRMGEHSLVTAKSLGYAAMQFNAVVASNQAAVALWKSLGFRVIGTVPEAFSRPDGLVDLLIMHRML